MTNIYKQAILGIDFGTSKSVASILQNGLATIIPDIQGHNSMPSLVMVSPDEKIYIGREALNHPDRYKSQFFTISSIKRQLGKFGETSWGKYRTYPQEISALILARLKMQAESYCNRTFDEAVIAVPAHFDINQRWATIQAAEIAGLKTIRLVNEASAAIFTYLGSYKAKNGTAIVFDFGAGTLDISIIEYGEGVFQVRATMGDDRLGGDDFDQKIYDYFLEKAKQDLGISNELTLIQQLVLKEAVIKAKIELSSVSSTRIYIPGFFHGINKYYDMNSMLDRDTFEHLCLPLFDHAERILNQTFRDAGVKSTDLSDLFLIGGTSKIPFIRNKIQQITNLKPNKGIDPDIGVAQGASILAGILSGEVKDILMLDVVSSTYSVEMKGGIAKPLVERNTTIPCQKSQTFTTTEDMQREISIRIFEGEKLNERDNTLVGMITLNGIPPAPRGVPQIAVTFDIKADNVLSVNAKDLGTGKSVNATMESPYRLNTAQIKALQRKVVSELQAIKLKEIEIREIEQEINARQKALIFIEEINNFVSTWNKDLPSEFISLLDSGKKLISDYLGWNVPPDTILRLISSINETYKNANIYLLEAVLKPFGDSPELIQWTKQAAESWKYPNSLKSSFEQFEQQFNIAIESISSILEGKDSLTREFVIQKVTTKLEYSPTTLILFALIIYYFCHEEIRIYNIDTSKPNVLSLYTIFILGHLIKDSTGSVRQFAGQELFNLFKGKECFFLNEYFLKEKDQDTAEWLRKCITEIPQASWFWYYRSLKSNEKEYLVKNKIALREIRNSSISFLNDANPDLQLFAYQVLEKVGIQDCFTEILTSLSSKHDKVLTIRLINLIAHERDTRIINPLLDILKNKNKAIRNAAFIVLEKHVDLMTPEIGRFYKITQNVISKGLPISVKDKLFLWKFSIKHQELKEIIDTIK